MAFCENCGSQVGDQAVACMNCGHPTGHAGPAVAGVRKTEGTAIASLVLGIGGLIMCPIILSILAIIFGKQAQQKIQANPALEGEGLARAGVVLGWIGLALFGLLLLIGLLIAAGTAATLGLVPL